MIAPPPASGKSRLGGRVPQFTFLFYKERSSRKALTRRGFSRATAQQLGQHLALAFERLTLVFERLTLVFERLTDHAGVFPHSLGQHINFSISPRTGFPHPLQSHKDRDEPPATDGKLGNLHPARAPSGGSL